MNRLLNTSTINGMIMRNLFEWRRNLDRMVDSIWWATVDLIFWGLTSNYLKQSNPGMSEIVSFFLGGLIFWTFVQNSQRDINMPLLLDAWTRNLINLFTTPIRLREFVVSTLILGLIKLAITSSVLSLLAYLLYQFNIFRFGWYLIPAIVNLIFVGWWIGFIIDGLILRYGYRVEAFAWSLIFVIYPFSAVFYPVRVLPDWAQFISGLLPTSYIFETMRSILFQDVISWNNLIISFVLNIFYFILSLSFLNRMFSDGLKHARLVKLN